MRGRVASRGRPSAPEHGIQETGTPGNTYGRSGILSVHWQCFPPRSCGPIWPISRSALRCPFCLALASFSCWPAYSSSWVISRSPITFCGSCRSCSPGPPCTPWAALSSDSERWPFCVVCSSCFLPITRGMARIPGAAPGCCVCSRSQYVDLHLSLYGEAHGYDARRH